MTEPVIPLHDLIANRLMMWRRGNPAMGGPNPSDHRHADDLIEELRAYGHMPKEDEVVIPLDEIERLRAENLGWPFTPWQSEEES